MKFGSSRWRPISKEHMRLKPARTCEADYTSIGGNVTCPAGRSDAAEPSIDLKPAAYSGAALFPSELDSFDASEAITITTAISAITMVQIALISGFTPSRTSE